MVNFRAQMNSFHLSSHNTQSHARVHARKQVTRIALQQGDIPISGGSKPGNATTARTRPRMPSAAAPPPYAFRDLDRKQLENFSPIP